MKTIYLMRYSIPEKINLETSLIPLSTDGLNLQNLNVQLF